MLVLETWMEGPRTAQTEARLPHVRATSLAHAPDRRRCDAPLGAEAKVKVDENPRSFSSSAAPEPVRQCLILGGCHVLAATAGES
jgi:hypothetical protein